MSLRDVLALAGGVAPQGREDRVELRRGQVKTLLKTGGKDGIQTVTLQSGDQLYVPQRSWASRNAPLLAGSLTAAAGILVSLLVHR
jgi:protein involved in polysaccharide export with SLBB domain